MPDNKQDQETEKVAATPINPDTWTTGTEPISDKQAQELETLANKTSTAVPPDLSAAGAQIQIDSLRQEQKDKP